MSSQEHSLVVGQTDEDIKRRIEYAQSVSPPEQGWLRDLHDGCNVALMIVNVVAASLCLYNGQRERGKDNDAARSR